MSKENIEDWKPFAYVFGDEAYEEDEWGCTDFSKRNIKYYEKSWYCKENMIIHSNEKQVLNCKHCSKKYYKLNKDE